MKDFMDRAVFDPSVQAGDARNQPATFTRIVLPFPYRLQGINDATPGAGVSGLHFVEAAADDWLHGALVPKGDCISPEDRQRRDYFTRETAKVLFERAKWFVLRGKAEQQGPDGNPQPVDLSNPGEPDGFKFHSPTKRAVKVRMRPPALVLFEVEWPEYRQQERPGRQASQPENDPLQVGFIILELFFPLSTPFSVDDLADFPSLGRKLKQPSRPFDTWLAAQLSSATQAALGIDQDQGSDPAPLQRALLQDINRILRGASIYEQKRFAGIALRSETQTLISRNPQGSELERLNRLLIEDAYPMELSRTPTFDDLLALNELFRYWQRPFEGHAAKDGEYRQALQEAPSNLRKPEHLFKDYAGNKPEFRLYLHRWASLLECPLVTGAKSRFRLVGKGESKAAALWVCGRGGTKSRPLGSVGDCCGWMEYADHRAFVWTCAVLDTKKPESLGENEWRAKASLGQRGALASTKLIARFRKHLEPWPVGLGHWIRLLNVDLPDQRGQSSRATAYERKWVDERTYKRWAHYGALYGFNYHAGAMLTGYCEAPPTWRHFRDMYFDQTLLMLYLRTVLFRFSLQLSRVSEIGRRMVHPRNPRPEIPDEFRNRFAWLRQHFAMFTNLYQFPLLSNQQQGIEMYEICRKAMDVDDLFKEVKVEIESTHEFLSIEADQQIADTTMRLTVVATAGLAAALTVSFWGADFLLEGLFCHKAPRWLCLGIAGVSAIASCVLVAELVRRYEALRDLFKNLGRFPSAPPFKCINQWLDCQAEAMRKHRSNEDKDP
jgi:hypothetical protein